MCHNEYMTTIAHIISASYIAVRLAKIVPAETDYITLSLISAGFIDVDHLIYLVKDRKYYKLNGYVGKFHKARSPLHELTGFIFFSLIILSVGFINLKLSLVLGLPAMIHIIEDMLIGRSKPLSPFFNTEFQILPQNISVKFFIDITVIVIFGFLWLKFIGVQTE